MSLLLSSPAFHAQEEIPSRYTCDGDNISPPLSWSDIPQEAASLALILDDPDAPRGTFTHWVLFDLPVDVQGLPEAVPATERPLGGAVHGRNDFGQLGYGGPCPPPGPAHRYRFVLYALNTTLGLAPGATAEDLRTAMQGLIRAQTEVVGTYRRAKRA